MGEAYDKREHSTKREVDDLTDYQKLPGTSLIGCSP